VFVVMPGLVPGTHVFRTASKPWMAPQLGLARVAQDRVPEIG
jgi:hypothetical protein